MRFGALVATVVTLACSMSLATGRRVDECKCGFVGELCNETGFYDNNDKLVIVDEVKKFTSNGTCPGETSSGCRVSDDDEREAKCVCNYGFKGDLCEVQRNADVFSTIMAGMLIPLALSASLGFYGIIKAQSEGGKEWKYPARLTVEGKASRTQLMFYRLVVGLFCLGIFLYQWTNHIIENGNVFLLRFYTIWNFLLLCTYFAIGNYLSIKAYRNKDDKLDRPANLLENIFLVIMEVEFSSTLLIAIVVWLVLWPAAQANDDDGLLGFVSLVQHGINIALMGGDFALNGLHMNARHFRFVIMWGTSYVVVHSIIMLIELSLDIPHKPSYFFLNSEAFLPMFIAVAGLIFVMTIFYFLAYGLNRLKGQREDMDMDINDSDVEKDQNSGIASVAPASEV